LNDAGSYARKRIAAAISPGVAVLEMKREGDA